MSSAIEGTVKALVEFESGLDTAKAEVSEAKTRTMKDAADWAESAKATAISKAKEVAAKTVAKARDAAEAEATKIRKKGESDLKAFESSISKHKSEAAEMVASRLLGDAK